MEKLPKVVLAQLFGFLDTYDLFQLSLCSKKLNQDFNSNNLVKRKLIIEKKQIYNSSILIPSQLTKLIFFDSNHFLVENYM